MVRKAVAAGLALLALAGCGDDPLGAGSGNWVTLGQWSGTDDRVTEQFRVESREWRIITTRRNEDATGSSFTVFVHSGDGRLVTTTSPNGVGTDTTYVQGARGLYYLDVGSVGIDWTVQVQHQE